MFNRGLERKDNYKLCQRLRSNGFRKILLPKNGNDRKNKDSERAVLLFARLSLCKAVGHFASAGERKSMCPGCCAFSPRSMCSSSPSAIFFNHFLTLCILVAIFYSSVHPMVSRITYSRDELLHLGSRKPSLQRSVRRRFWLTGHLLTPPTANSESSSQKEFPVPARISVTRKRQKMKSSRRPCRVAVQRNAFRNQAVMTKRFHHPSVLLTNARSLRNKIDELHLLVNKVKPGLAIVTESWLNPEIDSSFLSVSNYNVIRKGRTSLGGGIFVL